MKRLEETYPKTIFVNLDENIIIYPVAKIKKILKVIPVLSEIKLKLKEIYQDFNKENKGFLFEMHSKDKKIESNKNSSNLTLALTPKPKNLIYNQNKLEDEKCKKIFELFKNTFEMFTFKKLPLKPIFQLENNEV